MGQGGGGAGQSAICKAKHLPSPPSGAEDWFVEASSCSQASFSELLHTGLSVPQPPDGLTVVMASSTVAMTTSADCHSSVSQLGAKQVESHPKGKPPCPPGGQCCSACLGSQQVRYMLCGGGVRSLASTPSQPIPLSLVLSPLCPHRQAAPAIGKGKVAKLFSKHFKVTCVAQRAQEGRGMPCKPLPL